MCATSWLYVLDSLALTGVETPIVVQNEHAERAQAGRICSTLPRTERCEQCVTETTTLFVLPKCNISEQSELYDTVITTADA